MSLILRLKLFQKFAVGGVGRWWWSKGIIEFRFGPNLGLELEAWTKLNNMNRFWDLFPLCWGRAQGW